MKWPEWWDWELELSPHLLKRMIDRRFTEVDLRRMLEHARGYAPDLVEGRWVISTHTISLQEQLLQKDIPFLRAVMPCEFTATLVKGRSNYVSLRRIESAGSRALATFQHPD